MKYFAAIMACLMATALFAAPPKVSKTVPYGFTENFTNACEQAKREEKLVYMVFCGSDWCGPCIRYEREILSQKKFVSKLKSKYVFVFIDRPQHQEKLSALAAKQNPELFSQFRIGGVPCTIITDPDGNELKRKGGYRPGTEVKDFIKEIDELTAGLEWPPKQSGSGKKTGTARGKTSKGKQTK